MKAMVDAADCELAELNELSVPNESELEHPSRGVEHEWVPSPSQVVIGELIGVKDDACTALVLFAGQSGTAAVPARTILSLHGRDIGNQVALAFDGADVSRPIVLGVLRRPEGSARIAESAPATVEADGERLIVTAREQLILRCGGASITLTREGKVLIEGSFVSTRSAGVNRIRGGSVQIN